MYPLKAEAAQNRFEQRFRYCPLFSEAGDTPRQMGSILGNIRADETAWERKLSRITDGFSCEQL